MGFLIDASVLIGHERGNLDIESSVRDRSDEPFFLSVVTISELLHGVYRARNRTQRARRSVFVEGVIERFPRLPIDLPTARVHAEIWSELARLGTPVGPHDLWIAAACMAHGLTLATLNVREFARVPELEIEDWSRG